MLQQFLNLGNPINRSFPLNRGRAGFWLVVPNWTGGKSLRDLAGRNSGALTNFTSSSGWRSTLRQGGFGQLLFDGVDDSVVVSTPPSLVFPFSFSCCFNVTTTASQTCIASYDDNGATSGNAGWRIAIGRTGANVDFVLNGIVGFAFTTLSVSTNKWYYFAATATSSSCVGYLGDFAGSFKTETQANSSAMGGTPNTLRFGARDVGGNFFSGPLDSFSAYSGRALSAAEVWSDYDQSRRGYPEALNWIRTPGMLAQAAAAPAGVFFRRTLYRRAGSRGVAA